MSLSDEAHDIIDAAVADLRDVGLEGPAPWRALAWTAFDALREELCDAHAREDLTRLRVMLDKHLSELGGPVQ